MSWRNVVVEPRRVHAEVGADEYSALGFGQVLGPRRRGDLLAAGDAGERHRSAKEVIEREHGVSLAAAEDGLEMDDRVPALSSEPADRAGEQRDHTLGEVGASEELAGVPVLRIGIAVQDLGEICRELGLLVATLPDVRCGSTT